MALLFNDTILAGASEDITIARQALVTLIHTGHVRLHVRRDSTDTWVPFYPVGKDGAGETGVLQFTMAGTTLRVTARGGAAGVQVEDDT